MPWGLFALVFVISVIVGAARKPRRPIAPTTPPEEMN